MAFVLFDEQPYPNGHREVRINTSRAIALRSWYYGEEWQGTEIDCGETKIIVHGKMDETAIKLELAGEKIIP